MESRYVYSLLADILRACESLTLDLFASVLIVYLLITSVTSRYVYSFLADMLRAGEILIQDLFNSVLVI